MKKLSLILAVVVLFTTIFPASVAALNVGDKLGDVLNTDIKTYINGERIPCYNINNKSVVLIADLRNYGFDVTYDEAKRIPTVVRNRDKEFTPIQNIPNNTEKVGTVAFSYVYTNITTIVNGEKVDCFDVKGHMAIYFSSLGEYGYFTWDNITRASKLTLDVVNMDLIDYDLERAVIDENYANIESLLQQGANPNSEKLGIPLLNLTNDIHISTLLIEYGADVNATNNDSIFDNPIIFYKISVRESEIVKLYIDNGLDLEVKNRDGLTPLEF